MVKTLGICSVVLWIKIKCQWQMEIVNVLWQMAKNDCGLVVNLMNLGSVNF